MQKTRFVTLAMMIGVLVLGVVMVRTGAMKGAPPMRRPPPRHHPKLKERMKRLPSGKLVPRYVVPLRRRVLIRRTAPGAVVVQQGATVIRERPVVHVVSSADALPSVPVMGSTAQPGYKVVRVDSGYAVILRIDGKDTPVRMLGIEGVEATTEDGKTQTLDKQIDPFVRNLLIGEFVYLEHDEDLSETDEDGKLVGYLYRAPDRLLVNLEIVRGGYALTANSYDFAHADTFRFYEEKAQTDGKGIWSGLHLK